MSEVERVKKYEAKYDGEVFYRRIKFKTETMFELFSQFAEISASCDHQLEQLLEQFKRTGKPAPDAEEIEYIPNKGQIRDWLFKAFRKLKTASATEIENLHRLWLEKGLPEDAWKLTLKKLEEWKETHSRFHHEKLIVLWEITPYSLYISTFQLSHSPQTMISIEPESGG